MNWTSDGIATEEHFRKLNSNLWYPSAGDETDTAEVDEQVLRTVQIGFSVMFALAFLVNSYVHQDPMDPDRLESRRRRQLARQNFVSKSLDVKYVIEDDTEHSDDTPTAFTRTKSSLVLSKPNDPYVCRDSTKQPWVCSICLAEYEVGDKITWSKNPLCFHVFHHECIEQWLYKHDECPLCREDFFDSRGHKLDPSSEEGFAPFCQYTRESTLPAPEAPEAPEEVDLEANILTPEPVVLSLDALDYGYVMEQDDSSSASTQPTVIGHEDNMETEESPC
eukprot:Nitzschia sp. Nitz4//scaffold17_size182527//88045//89019//NITZ4_001854-RA/size182527-snap-gene-0.280-mRNA-1//1//CDS//3329539340//412//frame0